LTNPAFLYILKTNKIPNNYIYPGMRKKEFSMAAFDILSNDNLLIMPDHTSLSYSGRIDFFNPTTPCFIYAGSSVHFRFHGTEIKIIIRNYHSYYDNYIGYVIDSTIQGKVKLDLSDTVSILTIAEAVGRRDISEYRRQSRWLRNYLHSLSRSVRRYGNKLYVILGCSINSDTYLQ
jgi:hypothetical protein